MASLFASFGVAPAVVAPPPAQAIVEAKAPPVALAESAAVLPPDAPASDPALAALAPKFFMPPGITEVKKRGRPPGAKNRLEIQDVSSDAAPAKAETAQKAEAPRREVAPFKVTEISLRHGARISLGKNSFSSVEVEVEMKAEIFGDPDAAREALSVFVKQGMHKELSVYQVAVPAPEVKP